MRVTTDPRENVKGLRPHPLEMGVYAPPPERIPTLSWLERHGGQVTTGIVALLLVGALGLLYGLHRLLCA